MNTSASDAKPAIIKTPSEMTAFSAAARKAGKTIGFVPTMGALHDGHFSLMRQARRRNDVVVVSIFVNPTQFGPNEDLSKYPRTFDQDVTGCGLAGVAAIFAPAASDMYPPAADTFVCQERLTGVMCGASRPGHFRGVLTVCCKLFNIIQPHVAYFGQKDYQQAKVICRMAANLFMPLQIEVCPTVREHDGLAMSSRNRYLGQAERRDALCLYESLKLAEQMIRAGAARAADVSDAMKDLIRAAPSATIDYVAIADPETLEPIEHIDWNSGTERILVALAVKIGSTRLIDNMLIPRPDRPRPAGGRSCETGTKD